MTPRALQMVQRFLITATTIVLALVVLAAFVRVLRPADPEVIAAASTTTTFAPPGGGDGTPTGTTQPDNGQDDEVTETTTTTQPPSCEPPPAGDGGTVLLIFFTCGTPETPTPDAFVRRSVPDTQAVLTATLTEMVAGPTQQERRAGFTSFFTGATEGAFTGVSIDNRVATVDFTGLESVEGISSPPGSEFFLAELNANVFQFDTIGSVEYRLDGDCGAFYELIGQACTAITRAQWESAADRYRSGG